LNKKILAVAAPLAEFCGTVSLVDLMRKLVCCVAHLFPLISVRFVPCSMLIGYGGRTILDYITE